MADELRSDDIRNILDTDVFSDSESEDVVQPSTSADGNFAEQSGAMLDSDHESDVDDVEFEEESESDNSDSDVDTSVKWRKWSESDVHFPKFDHELKDREDTDEHTTYTTFVLAVVGRHDNSRIKGIYRCYSEH
ncbi:hypothetical protein J6590_079162 [Homalodisca vitripennis]|nr:hypothetical protein J6590_028182 [Homalodisca vitripennis]KAG8329779.1 hypothetical protein J6590_079162 [Homalodisca vitripennis]